MCLDIGDRQRTVNIEEVESTEGVRIVADRSYRRCVEAHRRGYVRVEPEKIARIAPKKVSRSLRTIEAQNAIPDARHVAQV